MPHRYGLIEVAWRWSRVPDAKPYAMTQERKSEVIDLTYVYYNNVIQLYARLV